MFVTRSLSLDFPTYPLCDQDKFFKFSGLHLQSVYWNACTQSYDRHLSWGLGSSVQFSRSVRVSDSLQPHELQHSLLKLMSIELVMPSNHLILCRPLLLLPSIFPSIRVSSNESVLRIRWPKYWRFSITPSNEYSGLISFRMDWLDLLQSKRPSRVFSNTTVQKQQTLIVVRIVAFCGKIQYRSPIRTCICRGRI